VAINDNQKFSLKEYRDKLYDEIMMKRKSTVKKSYSINKYQTEDPYSQDLDNTIPSP
jgi:hypothetical protein